MVNFELGRGITAHPMQRGIIYQLPFFDGFNQEFIRTHGTFAPPGSYGVRLMTCDLRKSHLFCRWGKV
jgi:hypothetical protein